MGKRRLLPRINKICECGHGIWSHYGQSVGPVDFANGKSIRAEKLFCFRCRKHCGLSTTSASLGKEVNNDLRD